MKNIIILTVFLLTQNLIGEELNQNGDLKADAGVKKEFIVNKAIKIRKIDLKNNANVKIDVGATGEVIVTNRVLISKNSNLAINSENNNKKKYALELKSNYSTNLEENSILKIKSNAAGLKSSFLFKLDTNSILEINSIGTGLEIRGVRGLDIFNNSKVDIYSKSLGIKVPKLNNYANIKVESLGNAIEADNVEFKGKGEDKAKTIVKANKIGIDSKNIIFNEKSQSFITSGFKGIVTDKRAEFKKGSETIIIANKAISKNHDARPHYFESGSEEVIIAGASAFYEPRLRGKTKLIASAHNIFGQALLTQEDSGKKYENLDSFVLEKGSILNGNILKSGEVKIELSEGAKFFIPDRIGSHFVLKGDLYVGPRSAYEKDDIKDIIKDKMKTFMNEKDFLKFKEEVDKGAGYKERNPNEYYTLEYKRYESGDDDKTPAAGTDAAFGTRYFDLKGGKIHLRFGGKFESNEAKNDKIILKDRTINGKNTEIEIVGTGAEIVLHPRNIEKIKLDDKFDFIEEINLNKEDKFTLKDAKIKLNDFIIGPFIFSRNDEIKNNKYTISLKYQGQLTESALLMMKDVKKSYGANLSENFLLKEKIFDETKDKSFWTFATKEKKQNEKLYLGYNHLLGKSTIGIFAEAKRLDSYGIYTNYNLNNFVMGILFKKQKSEKNKIKYRSTELLMNASYKYNFINSFYLKTGFTTTFGKLYSNEYKKDNIKIKTENMHYLRGDLNTEFGYAVGNKKVYLKFNIGKHISGNEKAEISAVENENLKIFKDIEHKGYDKKIAIGGRYDINNHSINLEMSKFLSENYKENIRYNIIYSYKF